MAVWKECAIGDLCSTISDTYKRNDEYVVLINTSDVLEGKVLNHTVVENKNLKGQFKKTFKRNDILYSEIRPANKRFAFVDFDDTSNYIASTKLMVIRHNEKVLPEFLYAVLKSESVIKELQQLAETRSGTFPQITFSSELAPMKIKLPDKVTQKKIVDVLSCIENKIENNLRINNNLEQQARAIYQNMFENIDSLPAGWHKVPLGEVINISNKSFNPLKEPETLLEHYSIPAYDDAKFPVFELSTEIKSNKFIIDDSCFMISKLNPTTKRVWRPYCLTNNAVCSTEFIVYKAKEESLTDYLYSVINSDSFSEFMCSHVTGSTGSRQRTTPKDTLFFEVLVPTEEELEVFQTTVAPMYAQMRNIAIENNKLKETRDALLPRLMSGEIDVSNV